MVLQNIVNWDMVEGLTLPEIKLSAIKVDDIKQGIKIYFVKTEPYYGILGYTVFQEKVIDINSQIHYGDDFEDEEIFQKMIKKAKVTIFTLEELGEKPKKYWEYYRKRQFVVDNLRKLFESVSIFHIGEYSPEEKAIVEMGHYSKAGMCYFTKAENAEYLDTYYNLVEEKYKEALKNKTFRKDTIITELYNHEAFYSYDIESTYMCLACDGFTREEIWEHFQKEYRKKSKRGDLW